jgi:hypothetical protein
MGGADQTRFNASLKGIAGASCFSSFGGVLMFYSKNTDHRLVTYILTQEQLAAIGSVVVESTFCEEQVERLIWRLCKLDPEQGKFLTGSINMNSRLDLLSVIGKPLLRSEVKRRELTKLISDLKESNNARNVVVHGTWMTDGVGVLQVLQEGAEKHPPAVAHKRRPNSPPLTKSAANIAAIAFDIARLSTELSTFSRAWRRVPSPDKELQQDIARSRRRAQTQPKAQAKPRQPKSSQE